MINEATIESKLTKYCREKKVFTSKVGSIGRRGFPDRVLIHRGKVVFLELKTDTGKLTELQKDTIERMREAGADVRVTQGWEQAKQTVDEIMR